MSILSCFSSEFLSKNGLIIKTYESASKDPIKRGYIDVLDKDHDYGRLHYWYNEHVLSIDWATTIFQHRETFLSDIQSSFGARDATCSGIARIDTCNVPINSSAWIRNVINQHGYLFSSRECLCETCFCGHFYIGISPGIFFTIDYIVTGVNELNISIAYVEDADSDDEDAGACIARSAEPIKPFIQHFLKRYAKQHITCSLDAIEHEFLYELGFTSSGPGQFINTSQAPESPCPFHKA
jgi:hypothetical protein